jgi:hypothetical protein
VVETSPPAPRHFLVVTDDGDRDVNVEHDPACPFADEPSGVEGISAFRRYLCDVGIVVSFDGLECAPEFAELAPGRYEIEAWSEPGRWYGTEWSDPDGGLRLIEKED